MESEGGKKKKTPEEWKHKKIEEGINLHGFIVKVEISWNTQKKFRVDIDATKCNMTHDYDCIRKAIN